MPRIAVSTVFFQSRPPPQQRKLWQVVENKKHLDDEDNRTLVPCFILQCEQIDSNLPLDPLQLLSRLSVLRKHQALAAEKSQCEAWTKEEQEAGIKQMRKNMVVKANTVPSFYQEGPPLKVELRKLPVTRAKSPNLTRRKSSGNAVNSCHNGEGGACSRGCRHSMGSVKVNTATKVTAPINELNGRSGGFKLFV